MYSAKLEHKIRKYLASTQLTSWGETSAAVLQQTARIITAIILVIIR
ncbi:hypothetical protein [Photobacterium leiognathi]|nr:hypothetical protein [Photobacterium leiognathi]